MPRGRRNHQKGGEQVTASDIIGDKEAASLFGISLVTLRHHVMKKYVCPAGKIDVRKACPVIVGRVRRWNRKNIIALLNCPVV